LARANNIQGTVAVTFIVNKDGSVSSGEIIRDIGGGCGQEVLRVLSLMPDWVPGEVDGLPVKVRFTLPVRFRLEGDTKKKKN
jgi:protein TonB